MSFFDIHQQYSWNTVRESILAKTTSDVQHALSTQNPTLEDFKALVSPAAEGFLEEMAQKSQQLTMKRFGKTMQLYIPLYLSNECTNSCVYCGFNHKNKMQRITLSKEEVMREVEVIKSMNFNHLLLVTGEHPRKAGLDYLLEVIEWVRPYFAQISIEVAPMDVADYQQLMNAGLHAVYIYQETYNAENYNVYHPAGKKADFRYRLETPDRLGEAGIHKMGLGVLLGLEDWRTDSFFTALHLKHLEKTYWKTKYSIAFPRLRPHAGSFEPNVHVTDKNLFQLICAYRILSEEVEISMSTRENPIYRNNMVGLGVTTMSAGSKTEPGGYANSNKALEQFAVSDDRSVVEISAMINAKGYETIWKDWDLMLAE